MATQKTKWMFIGGAAVVAVGLVIALRQHPLKTTETSGAIGGADRYHNPQIATKDVKVDETEMNKWLQSPEFTLIVSDPEARKLFTDAHFQILMANDGFQAILANDTLRQALMA